MDPFSAGTGALSVISLAIQLGAGVNKLWTVFNSISDAPKEVKSILEDLRLLRTLLASIQETEEVLGPDAVTNKALEICRKSIRNLTNIVDSLAPGFASQNSVKRKWTAIGAVMRTEKILKFKAGLEEAKSSLILAQSISLERNNRQRHQCIEQTLLPLQQLKQGMSKIHEIHNSLIFQSRTMTTTDSQASNTIDGLSSDIHKAVESWSSKQLHPIFEAELSKAIQACVSNMNQEQKPESNTTPGAPASNDRPNVTTFSKAFIRRSRKVGPLQSRSSRTGFGTLCCFVTTYEVVREVISPPDVVGDDANFGPVKQRETNIRFIFTPSRWLIKVGASQVLQFEKSKSDSRCWQKTLRTFKLVPYNAPVFEFCREGNVGAVRRLLINGHASVDDVNRIGETPLHIAAGYCQAETCLFLLQQGADRNVRDWGTIPRKPFGSACSPGQQMDDRCRSLLPTNLRPNMINTMKAFFSVGEEVDEAASEEALRDVFIWEN